ncbi:MAG TPA: adenylyl-sulfate kinase [Candidatus Sabulitectum sp.]|nr:adenylyl-sulfate kinase [Candidatus Sabulitectum sp.]HPJ29592.1 adenylyl-sulfate kinase [Candidatus Sabulitectum sp.]HPR22994.1 adenylyl-sulfate kinase [Candidatus Sabulitectum sp.]
MTTAKDRNITWHDHAVSREDMEKLNNHRGATVWFTGLSASGKSTVADYVARMLHSRGFRSAILDGDNVRHGLNSDLGFSPEDRTENIRRISEVAKLLTSFGIINLVAFISPYREDRDRAREIQREGDFIEVFVDAPLEVVEKRDPKGLYKKARAGEIPSFTGISAPYEAPENPEIHLRTDGQTPMESAAEVVKAMERLGVIPGA